MLNKALSILQTYFFRVGVIAHYLALVFVILLLCISSYIYVQYDLPAKVFFKRASHSLSNAKLPLLQELATPVKYLSEFFSSTEKYVRIENNIIGSATKYSMFSLEQNIEDKRIVEHHNRLAYSTYSRNVFVNTEQELLKALKQAKAGDDIVISAGTYHIKSSGIYLNAEGKVFAPIRLRAEYLDDVILKLDTVEGFIVKGGYWIFENLVLEGTCKAHARCEHAIHITGASNLIIRNNTLKNFNSTIKANGLGNGKNRKYPDNILIESNSIYNESSRQTASSVTLIDVVAGNDWIVRKNLIANNSKALSDRTSYAAFFKGNGRNGLFEQNIINCEWTLANDNTIRLGLSLGGGGTGEKYCRDGTCISEHKNGVIRNNLIGNCSQDVGIYLNKATDSIITDNTLINTLGIDVRYPESTANIARNVLTGSIRARDLGTFNAELNIENVSLVDLTVLPRASSPLTFDICSERRAKYSLIGAVGDACMKKLKILDEKNEKK